MLKKQLELWTWRNCTNAKRYLCSPNHSTDVHTFSNNITNSNFNKAANSNSNNLPTATPTTSHTISNEHKNYSHYKNCPEINLPTATLQNGSPHLFSNVLSNYHTNNTFINTSFHLCGTYTFPSTINERMMSSLVYVSTTSPSKSQKHKRKTYEGQK